MSFGPRTDDCSQTFTSSDNTKLKERLSHPAVSTLDGGPRQPLPESQPDAREAKSRPYFLETLLEECEYIRIRIVYILGLQPMSSSKSAGTWPYPLPCRYVQQLPSNVWSGVHRKALQSCKKVDLGNVLLGEGDQAEAAPEEATSTRPLPKRPSTIVSRETDSLTLLLSQWMEFKSVE